MKARKERVSVKEIARAYTAHVREHALLMILVFVGTIGAQFCSIFIPVYLSDFFNELVVMASDDATGVAVLYGTLLVITLLFVTQWFFRRMFGISIVLFELRMMHDLYISAFDYLIKHSHQFFTSQFSGTLTRRVSKYVSAFETLFDSIAMTFTPAFVFITGAVIVLYHRHPILGFALGLWSVAFLAFHLIVSHLRQPVRIRRTEADSRMIGGLADAITNQHAITLFANVRHEFKLFSTLVSNWKDATHRSWLVDEYIWAAQGLLMIGIQVGLLFGALHFWLQGQLQIGDFVLVQVYVLGIIDLLVGITRELRRVYDAIADAGDMVAVLKEPHGIADKAGARALTVKKGEIAFRDVRFAYSGARRSVLTTFDLAVAPGQRVGLVGKSGAGKSTVMKLLLRQYEVDTGAIVIDGSDIADVTQDSLHEAISVVPQEPLLFHRSIRENIAYGKLDASDEEVMHAAKLASAHDFIERLPEGYDSLVGERGVKLSGGERQRIAIARAILKNAPILLLDEATSSLDSESEVEIQKALHKLMEGKTVIAIAHRLSTLREMDRIIVMEEGRIVEDGTHAELVMRKGVYADLWNHQAGGFLQDE